MTTIETKTVAENSKSIKNTELLDVTFKPTVENFNTIKIHFNDFFPNTTFAPPTTIVRKLLKLLNDTCLHQK